MSSWLRETSVNNKLQREKSEDSVDMQMVSSILNDVTINIMIQFHQASHLMFLENVMLVLLVLHVC